MSEPVRLEIAVPGLTVGWVRLEGVVNGPSPEALRTETEAAVRQAADPALDPLRAARKEAVRALLRHGKYRPSGRGKPASEYLLNAATEGRFPAINLLADLNNLVSLESLFPISILDLDLAGTSSYHLRWGRPGEVYVFNASEQVLDLEDLLLAARLPGDDPCATPVKDRHSTKTGPTTTRALALLYAPEALAAEVEAASIRLADLGARLGGARVTWGLTP